MGGIGKSALAAVAICRLREEGAFPDGIAVVLCENQRDPVEVLRQTLSRFAPGRRAPDADDLPSLTAAAQTLPAAAVPVEGARRLDLLDADDALLLFAQSYRRADVGALNPDERAAAVRIVTLLDRHTLAVRLAGACAAELGRPLPRVAEEIASDLLRVPEGETPRKVEAVLARSVEALRPDGQGSSPR